MRRLAVTLITLLFLATTAIAAIEEAPFDDIDQLIADSDIIVEAHVTSLQQRMRDTRLELIVDQIYAGTPATKTIIIRHKGGKFLHVPTEPMFTSYDKSILYLKDMGEYYKVIRGARGKKRISNDFIYLHPDNSFINMRYKNYVKELVNRVIANGHPAPKLNKQITKKLNLH